jgi:hypothetical protein
MLVQVDDQHTVDRLPPSLIEIPHAPSTISISLISSIRVTLLVYGEKSSADDSKIEMVSNHTCCIDVDNHDKLS